MPPTPKADREGNGGGAAGNDAATLRPKPSLPTVEAGGSHGKNVVDEVEEPGNKKRRRLITNAEDEEEDDLDGPVFPTSSSYFTARRGNGEELVQWRF